MQNYCDYIKRVTAIHHETVRRLVDRDDTSLPELAELFEDVANFYLNISEEIHAHTISEEVRACVRQVPQATVPLPLIRNPAEAFEG
jgi:hypothetical protein